MSKRNDVNPLSVDEDFFIEVKERKEPVNPQTTEDIEYLLRNLYRALRIPKEYLGSDTYLKDDVE